MENPDVYQLTRIRWQFFGTLTFRSERLPEQIRRSMWIALCRKTSSDFGLYFPNLLWCLRQERGEMTDRRHFHYLLGGIPESAVTIQTCFSQRYFWQRFLQECYAHQVIFCHKCERAGLKGLSHWKEVENPAVNIGGGNARVRIFNRALNGVGYLQDCLSGSAAADQYEMCKYGLDSSEVVWSKGALAMLAREIREDKRRVQRSEKRQEIEASAQSVTHQGNSSVSVPSLNPVWSSLPGCEVVSGAASEQVAVSSASVVNGGDWAESRGPAGDQSHG